MNPCPIHIPLDQPDVNDNQFESFKYMSEFFMLAFVPNTEWYGNLKRLYNILKQFTAVSIQYQGGITFFRNYLMWLTIGLRFNF